MDVTHVMLPEDELYLAGMILLYGVLAGGIVRLVVSFLKARQA